MRIVCMGDAHYSCLRKTKNLRKMNKAFYTEMFRLFFQQDADLYVSLGDLTHYGRIPEFREVYGIISENKRENQRFVQVVGNHDVLLHGKGTYQRLTGNKLYWSEDHPEGKFIFLDSARAHYPFYRSAQMDEKQAAFLEQELRDSGDRLVVIFSHHPCHRIPIVNAFGKVVSDRTVEDILKVKTRGKGVYVNGHLHKDCYQVKENWAFLQFNDLLDVPTVRILDIREGEVTMDTVTLSNDIIRSYGQSISRALLTYKRTKNDEQFADVRSVFLREVGLGWMLKENLEAAHI